MNSLCLRAASFLGVLVLAGTCARGVLIEYTFRGAGSGSLNGVPFTAEPFRVVLTGDTDDLIIEFPSLWIYGMARIEFEHLGIATFAEQKRVFCNTELAVLGLGHGPPFGPDWLNLSDTSFATYHLDNDFGPVVEDQPQFGGLVNQATDLGRLDMSSLTGSVIFEAIGVPAPSAGCVLMLCTLRRRRR